VSLEQTINNVAREPRNGPRRHNEEADEKSFETTHAAILLTAPYGGNVTTRALVIKLTSGIERPEAANQALTIAATACAAGIPVSLWLAGEASWFATPGGAAKLQLAHAAPAEELLMAILAAGSVTLCTQCAVRRGIDAPLPGIRIAGSAVFVEEIMGGNTQALVY